MSKKVIMNDWQRERHALIQALKADNAADLANHHVSDKFRHGVQSWKEPNMSNRLSWKEA